MIWIICALVAAGLIAIGVKGYLNKKNGLLRVMLLLAYLFAAAYVAYFPLFYVNYGILLGLIGNLVHVLRLVTMDADLTQFFSAILDGAGNIIFAKAYVVMIGVLHLALPTISALTAVTVLFRCFSSMQLFIANRRKRPMFVFSEINERSLQLAKSLEHMKCDIIFANSSEDLINNENNVKQKRIFKEDSISELGIRSSKGKDVHFFCISEDEDLSLSHTLRLIEKYAQAEEAEQEHIHIYQFSKDQDFATFIDSAEKGSLDVQCMNEYEILIYNLLDRYPIYRFAEKDIHVLLYGLSEINTVALKAIAWCGQLGGLTIRISVVGVHIADKVNALRLELPGLFTNRYCVNFYDCEHEAEVVETISEKCADVNYIIVSDASDNATMNKGIILRRLFYKLDPNFKNCPPIFCYVQEPSKFNILQKLTTAESNPSRKVSYDLIPFGSLQEVYAYETIVASPLELLAKNVHLAYEEIFSDGDIDVKGALKRYNIFEVNKRSNRANALHIRYKLNLLGLDYTDHPEAEEVRLEDYYTEKSLKAMAISEHDRWMAFLEMEGWTPSTREEVLSYRASGISRGRHNCPILKMHPYICEYEKLKKLSLELEGKDTTVYDEELILRIPDILGDKWNVAGKKYKIIHNEQASGG